MENFVVAIVFFGVLFALMAVRIIFVKDGEFHGTCSTQRQAMEEKHAISCGVCGRTVEPGMDCSEPQQG